MIDEPAADAETEEEAATAQARATAALLRSIEKLSREAETAEAHYRKSVKARDIAIAQVRAVNPAISYAAISRHTGVSSERVRVIVARHAGDVAS